MRHKEEEHHKHYTETFVCIEQLVQQSNIRFDLLLRDAVLTLEHLNEAATHLRQSQKNSDPIMLTQLATDLCCILKHIKQKALKPCSTPS